jgi:hypothetical protein
MKLSKHIRNSMLDLDYILKRNLYLYLIKQIPNNIHSKIYRNLYNPLNIQLSVNNNINLELFTHETKLY